MSGLVVEVEVNPGDRVFKGQEPLTIESMNMDSVVASSMDGEVAAVEVKAGDAVDVGCVLVAFK